MNVLEEKGEKGETKTREQERCKISDMTLSRLSPFLLTWMPMRICFMVIAGRQSSSSLRIERQMPPDWKTLGWKRGGTNLQLGGFEGSGAGGGEGGEGWRL